MTFRAANVPEVLKHSPVTVVFGSGALSKLGELAVAEGATRVLLVTDPGIERAGHAVRAVDSLKEAGVDVFLFDGVVENPTTIQVDAGVAMAAECKIDFIIGLGGGSAMDCAKGTNMLYTNGGRVADYHGVNKTSAPMLPMIAVPTTAGTGSEAQSFALICDASTHLKMACGDRRLPVEGGLRPRVALLDPDLTASQPPKVAAAAGFDAIAHAVETAACNARSEVSRAMSREAWKRLRAAYPKVVEDASDAAARAEMLLGAHLAGAAIEQAMLGAAHACANPLTARCGVVHGVAVALMLPAVVRFNAAGGENPYEDVSDDADALARDLEGMRAAAGIPGGLESVGVDREMLPELARTAAEQWTASFNPRGVDHHAMLGIYKAAFEGVDSR